MNSKNIAFVLILIVALGGLFYLKNLNRKQPSVASVTTETPSNTTSAANLKEFTVTGQNFNFTPNIISVKKGDQVKITFKNADGFHDLRIDELNVATKQIKGGDSDTVTFAADKVGTFEYYCSVGQHRQMGMVGKFIVSE